MDNNTMMATNETYAASLKVLERQESSLYPNMLKVLAEVTQLNVPSATYMNNIRIKFWFKSILPLLFHDDVIVQSAAIDAFTAFIPHLMVSDYQNHEDWPMIKAILVDKYADKIGEFRERLNSNWYRIWCVIVNILNKEILRSAPLINRFLTVVEQGFRSVNMEIRAEAFLSWRALIETFSRNNELLAPKRIRLVCIPLKSSQSKTAVIAVNKFHVWWYLMCTIHPHLSHFIETIIQPFLVFCFGQINETLVYRHATSSPSSKTFKEIMPLSVVALISLLGPTCKEAVSIMERSLMEKMPPHCEAVVKLCKTNHTIIVNSCGEATAMIAHLDMPMEERKNLSLCLWRNLVHHINGLNCLNMYKLMMENIKALIKINDTAEEWKSLLGTIILTICRHCTIPLHYSDASIEVELRFSAGQQMVVLMLQSDICSQHQTQEVISRLYDISAMVPFTGYFNVLRCMTEFLINLSGKSDVRHKIWRTFQSSLHKYMQSQTNISTEADVILKFLMVPIIINHEPFTTYKDVWSRLAESVTAVFDRKSLCETCIDILRTNCFNVKELSDFVATLITLEEYSFKDVKDVPSAVFDHIGVVLHTTATRVKDLNPIAAAINTYVKRLGGVELLLIYARLKKIISDLEATVSSIRCDQSIINDFKNNVKQIIRNSKETQLLIRKCPDDALKRELTELQKESDFVFISSVWKFNPDRLTDSQKDKMKERRSDIPALYNDMSQSQESASIQAWKPKKLVLPHDDANESMVIEVNSNSTKETVTTTNGEVTPPTVINTGITTEATILTATCSKASTVAPGNTISKADLDPQISLSPASSTTSKTSEDLESRRNAKLQAELKKLEINIVASTEFQDVGKRRTRRAAAKKTTDAIIQPSSPVDSYRTRSSMASPKVERIKPKNRRNASSSSIDIEPQTTLKLNAEITSSKKAKIAKPKEIRNENGDSVALREKFADCSIDSLQESPTKKKKHTRGSSLDMNLMNIDSQSIKAQVSPIKAKCDDANDSVSSSSSPLSQEKPKRKTEKSKTTTSELDVNKTEGGTSTDTTAETFVPIFENVQTTIVKDVEPNVAPIVKDLQPTIAPFADNVKWMNVPIVKDIQSPVVESVEPTVTPDTKEVELFIAPNVKDVEFNTASIVNTAEMEPTISSPDTSGIIPSSQEPSMSLISGLRSFKRFSDCKPAAAVGINIQNMDTLPVNTECLSEVLNINTELPDTNSPIPDVAVANSEAVQKISEMDTEPNTERILDSATLTTVETDSAETNDEAISPTPPIYNDHPVAVSPFNSEDVNMIDADKSLNQSILTSPRISDIDSRNAELLNSTMNISPIPVSAKASLVDPEKNVSFEQRKLFDNISRISTSPPSTSAGTLLPVPQHRLQSSTPSASIMNPAGNGNVGGSSPCSSRLNVQLKGRGAQLLNMINSRKIGQNITPNRIIGTLEATMTQQHSEVSTSAASNCMNDIVPINLFPNNEHTTTTNINTANKNLLTFSKVLPSPMASPSCSILKRKFITEDPDVGDFESPASKRKRVSFHDPPVSATKQYINHADEHVDRTKIANDQIQALMSRIGDISTSTATPCELRLKHILRRKSRADSMVELAKYERNRAMTIPPITTSLPVELSQLPILPYALHSPDNRVESSGDMEPLKWSMSNVSNVGNSTDIDDINLTSSGSITFEDKNAVIESVFEEYPIEELLEKYRASGRQFSAPAARILTKELSHLMQQNERTCSDTLEHLCENHPKSFLRHAIQENIGSFVCSYLTPAVIFDYIIEESKTDANIRATALEKFSAIAAHSPRDETNTNEWRTALLKILEVAGAEACAGDLHVKNKFTEIINGIYANNDAISGDLQQFIISLLSNRKIKPEQVVQFMAAMVTNKDSTT